MKRSKRHRIKRNKISTRQAIQSVKEFIAYVKSESHKIRQYYYDENKKKYLLINP
jgi:hypothetical protein